MQSGNIIARTRAMLPASSDDIVVFSKASPPKLVCIVDAEEEFDWSEPFSSSNTSVTAMSSQAKAQDIFARFHLVPCYVVDQPVASQEQGFKPLLEFLQSGLCEIGAQLHPWVTPPIEERISEKNSFACNLPRDLQRRKLATLTKSIESSFRISPILFRSGRYGAGPDTIGLLQEFGYEIDCSVLPGRPITTGSPDYSHAPAMPYWLGTGNRILELPVTAGNVGSLRLHRNLEHKISSPIAQAMKIPSIFSRFGMLRRVRLSPEGFTLEAAKALTRAMRVDGNSVFTLSYHSPSLVPGRTPYTKTKGDVAAFLKWIEGYLSFFVNELGGVPSTPGEIRSLALGDHS